MTDTPVSNAETRRQSGNSFVVDPSTVGILRRQEGAGPEKDEHFFIYPLAKIKLESGSSSRIVSIAKELFLDVDSAEHTPYTPPVISIGEDIDIEKGASPYIDGFIDCYNAQGRSAGVYYYAEGRRYIYRTF